MTDSCTKILPLKEEEHKLDTIYLFNSKREIINKVVSMINKDNQNSIAIILNLQSKYVPLIRSGLVSKDVEIDERMSLDKNFNTREYLSIIETFHNLHHIQTRNVIFIG